VGALEGFKRMNLHANQNGAARGHPIHIHE
jgi:hypothetical protein